MSSDKLTIVVDGGASGCRLAAFDNLGVQRAAAQDGPASLSIGEEHAWRHISKGLSSLAVQIGEQKDWLPERLWMGLAGSLQSERHNRFLSLIPESLDAVVITDGHAQLLGASGGQHGVCLAMGTGSVVHWLDSEGNLGMGGGWGYPVGDEGSGAWLGIQLIKHYLWFRDKSDQNKSHNNKQDQNKPDKTSKMFAVLQQRIGTDVSDIQLWSTSTSPTDMASLAPIVVNAASEGDMLAETIVKRGTHYCQQLIDLAPAHLPVYVVGGLAELYAPRLIEHYGDRYQAAAGNALNGLYMYAKHQRQHPS